MKNLQLGPLGAVSPIVVAGLALLVVVIYDKGKQAVVEAANAVNPVNPNNVFASGVDAVGKSVSGDKYWTLGGWLYDVTHPSQNAPTPQAANEADTQLRQGQFQ